MHTYMYIYIYIHIYIYYTPIHIVACVCVIPELLGSGLDLNKGLIITQCFYSPSVLGLAPKLLLYPLPCQRLLA